MPKTVEPTADDIARARQFAPLTIDWPNNRWALIDPHLIATTASPRHVQSVLEDLRADFEKLRLAIRATREDLTCMDWNDATTYSEQKRHQLILRLMAAELVACTGVPLGDNAANQKGGAR